MERDEMGKNWKRECGRWWQETVWQGWEGIDRDIWVGTEMEGMSKDGRRERI